MSRPIYKPISFEDAARAMRENNTESLFIEIEDGTLARAAGFRLEVGRQIEESWYLRCEQEDEPIEETGYYRAVSKDVAICLAVQGENIYTQSQSMRCHGANLKSTNGRPLYVKVDDDLPIRPEVSE